MNGKMKEAKAFFTTIQYCMRLSWDSSRFYTIVRFVGRILTPINVILVSFLGKYVLDLLTGTWQAEDRTLALFGLLGAALVLALVNAGLNKAVQYSQSMQNDLVSKQISIQMMDKALNADLELFDNPKYYDKLTSATRDANALTFLLWNVLDCLSSCITFLSAFFILSRSNWLYGVLMLVAAVPSAIAARRYTKSLYHLSLVQVKGERQKNYLYQISTMKAYAQDIRLFQTGPELKQRYLRIWNELFSNRRKMNRRRSVWIGLVDCLPEFVVAWVGLDLAFKVLGGGATVGDYSLYTGLVSQLWSSIFVLLNSTMQIYDNKLKIANLQSLDQFPNRVTECGTRSLEWVRTIEFREVSFSYPDTDRKVLDGVSFSVGEGEKVALVGLNGSGKSTLVKLLLRFYDPDSGEILINGFDLRDYALISLRRSFSVYFQDMPTYSFTLRENLTIGDPEQQEETAAKQAFQNGYAEDILEKAPQGLDTYLTRLFEENGIELSGGQSQKVALARTFYRRSTALILDEPSSALDPEAENWVFESLQRLCKGKTTLFTSHRLSNVSLADRIVVLEQGHVLEQGTQAELLGSLGRYSELFEYQAKKYRTGRQEELCESR